MEDICLLNSIRFWFFLFFIFFSSVVGLHIGAPYSCSLNWQHQLCKSPKPNPDIKTLFVDHSCGPSQPNGARAPSPVTHPLMGGVPKPGVFPPLGAHGVNVSRNTN